MALNPQLVNVATAYGGKPTLFPLVYAGELVFGSREHSKFSIDGPRGYKCVAGTPWVSTASCDLAIKHRVAKFIFPACTL